MRPFADSEADALAVVQGASSLNCQRSYVGLDTGRDVKSASISAFAGLNRTRSVVMLNPNLLAALPDAKIDTNRIARTHRTKGGS
jgi:hypothetical protein